MDFLECIDNGPNTDSDGFHSSVVGGPTSITHTNEGKYWIIQNTVDFIKLAMPFGGIMNKLPKTAERRE